MNNKIVKINWNDEKPPVWNECCAMVLEVFGLPGNRFTCYPRKEYMEIEFVKETDAMLCKVLLSEKVSTTLEKT